MTRIIEGTNLKKYFPVRQDIFSRGKSDLHAVDEVDIHIDEDETLGLAGESGCGKTTLGRILVGLIKPTSGIVRFMGEDISGFSKKDFKKLRPKMQIIFQNPLASLNPRKTVRQILSQPYKIHNVGDKDYIDEQVSRLLEDVGLSPAGLYVDRYPHEFSGGQRQRIVFARSLCLNPKFVVADEPVSSLDISVRAQLLNLLKTLQLKFKVACLFITHDLSVLRSVSNRVCIMYLGEIVELASVDDIFSNPLHPYTEALLSATPVPNPRKARNRKTITLKGDPPSPIDIPPGCRFQSRCFCSLDKCSKQKPQLHCINGDHVVACHLRV
jgi:oligopeptide/dipeptide ABC transporter ATP-binding protein